MMENSPAYQQALIAALMNSPVVDDGYRYATYGGPVWAGGVYDHFRRSENIEDRRKQSYSAEMQSEEVAREIYLRRIHAEALQRDQNITSGNVVFPSPPMLPGEK